MRLYDFGFTFILIAAVCAAWRYGGGGPGRLSRVSACPQMEALRPGQVLVGLVRERAAAPESLTPTQASAGSR